MSVEWKADHAESPDVRTWRVLALVFGFLAFVVVLFGLLGFYYRSVLGARTVETQLQDFPAPRLQPNPNQDYSNFHAAQVKALEHGAPAGPAGTAPGSGPRLSIAQAMAAVVARGAQAYDPPPGTPPAGPTLATGAAMDGAPRATPSPAVAPYGKTP